MTSPTASNQGAQVPIKLYRSNDRLTVAAPMPGLEPADITAEVTGDNHLILHGEGRGAQKGINDEILNEWNPGPYHREVELPHPVDATIANMTYGNGVLVVSLPLSDEGQAATLRMQQTGADHGMLAGAAGHTATTAFADTGEDSPLDAGGDAEDNDRSPEANTATFADVSTADLMPDPLAQPVDTDAERLANDSVVEDDEIGDYQEAGSGADEAYFAPTDPVLTTDRDGNYAVLGGFEATADDAIAVDPSTSDDIPGDEALHDAVRSALRYDAATTDLRLHVHVHRGVVHLRGQVADLVDADNAQDVASRVPGVQDVIDETEIAGL